MHEKWNEDHRPSKSSVSEARDRYERPGRATCGGKEESVPCGPERRGSDHDEALRPAPLRTSISGALHLLRNPSAYLFGLLTFERMTEHSCCRVGRAGRLSHGDRLGIASLFGSR